MSPAPDQRTAIDAEVVPPAAVQLDPAVDAPSGWRRVLLGLLLGVLAGALLALILPRQRQRPEPPEAFGPPEPPAAVPAAAPSTTQELQDDAAPE